MNPRSDIRRPSLPTRVLCVDDNPDVTAVMRMVLDTDPTMRCVGCLSSADLLIETVRRLNPPPDVVLLDATMPGTCPLTAMGELTAAFPAMKTIIYSGHHDAAFIEKVRKAGASGCVSKTDEPDTILHAVREVAAGNPWWPRAAKTGRAPFPS